MNDFNLTGISTVPSNADFKMANEQLDAFRKKVAEKVKETFADLFPEAVFENMVQQEIKNYFETEVEYKMVELLVFSKTGELVPAEFNNMGWEAKDRIRREKGQEVKKHFLNKRTTSFRQDVWSLIQPYVCTWLEAQLKDDNSKITKSINDHLISMRQDILDGKVELATALTLLAAKAQTSELVKQSHEVAQANMLTAVNMLPFDQNFVSRLSASMNIIR